LISVGEVVTTNEFIDATSCISVVKCRIDLKFSISLFACSNQFELGRDIGTPGTSFESAMDEVHSHIGRIELLLQEKRPALDLNSFSPFIFFLGGGISQ
ncbi:hypothetical protein PMAYCL1PPCAC_25233, partial [Pristionchus mayeri]